MTQTLFTGWHFMRWLRLVVGIYIAGLAIQNHDSVSGFIAAFFLFQAATNTGCCGTASCAMPQTKPGSDRIEEIEFEEVKSK